MIARAALLALALSPAVAVAQTSPAGTAVAIRGGVTIGPPGAPGETLRQGGGVAAAEVVTTNAEGGAVIAITGGGQVEVGPASAFAFYRFEDEGRRFLAALARGQMVFEPGFQSQPDLICTVLPPDGEGVPFEARNVRVTVSPGDKPYAVACVRGAPPSGLVPASARFGRPDAPRSGVNPELAQALGVRPPQDSAPQMLDIGRPGASQISPPGDAFPAGAGADDPLAPPVTPSSGPAAVARARAALGVMEAPDPVSVAAIDAFGADAPPLAPPPVIDPLQSEAAQIRERIAALENRMGLTMPDAPPPLVEDPGLDGFADDFAPPLLSTTAPPQLAVGGGRLPRIGRAQTAFAPGRAPMTPMPGAPPLMTPAPGLGGSAPSVMSRPGLPMIGVARSAFPAPPRQTTGLPAAVPQTMRARAADAVDGAWRVQAGAFGEPANATRMVERLSAAGFVARIERQGGLDIVIAGAAEDRAAARAIAADIRARVGQDAVVIRR